MKSYFQLFNNYFWQKDPKSKNTSYNIDSSSILLALLLYKQIKCFFNVVY